MCCDDLAYLCGIYKYKMIVAPFYFEDVIDGDWFIAWSPLIYVLDYCWLTSGAHSTNVTNDDSYFSFFLLQMLQSSINYSYTCKLVDQDFF